VQAMSEVLELSSKLNKEILNSDTYRNYIKCKEKLKEHPELLRGFVEFKRRNNDIQNNENIDNPFDEINDLCKEFDELMHDTIVNDFIRAERKFCRMMKNIYDVIAEGFELDFTETEEKIGK
jgi:cell fate (sporulation/competence/biofilm development) regulator YlbF (YheA/YmcA/DUF963 family)